MLMLIDTREPPPEPGRHEPWLLTFLLDHLFPWPAVVVWMMAASLISDGWLGVVLSWGAVVVAFWRMSRAFGGVGGLRDYRQ
jgi:hypothetical protein